MRKTKLFMDTVVDIQVLASRSNDEAEAAVERAFEAFRQVERACSRFSPDSELMEACRQTGTPVQLSPFLFEPLKFALEVAKWTKGVFDPTVGKTMEEHGFNRHYLTGETVHSPASAAATYRDIVLQERDRTMMLRKPLVIDLGAVAKGFAIDLAARELKPFEDFIVNAGGDLYVGGKDETGGRWQIGIRHPEQRESVIRTVGISDEAVCTSGSYERRSEVNAESHHIIHPATGRSPSECTSCTVIAPYAMMADAFSTAAMLLGVERGTRLLEQAGLEGMFITSKLQICTLGDAFN
jgi:thiamine biosynthesis lipoprotein